MLNAVLLLVIVSLIETILELEWQVVEIQGSACLAGTVLQLHNTSEQEPYSTAFIVLFFF